MMIDEKGCALVIGVIAAVGFVIYLFVHWVAI